MQKTQISGVSEKRKNLKEAITGRMKEASEMRRFGNGKRWE